MKSLRGMFCRNLNKTILELIAIVHAIVSPEKEVNAQDVMVNK